VAFDVPPVVCAEHHSLRRLGWRVCSRSGEAGMPKPFYTGQDGLYKTPTQAEAQGAVHRSFTAMNGRRGRGGPFLVTFCGC